VETRVRFVGAICYEFIPPNQNIVRSILYRFPPLAVDHCFSNPCSNGGSCQSLFDGYECTCPSGYGGVNCEIGAF